MKPFNQYNRLFTFGCSTTNYGWPTWADILSTEIPKFYNYGKSGAGNLFISNSVVEANIKHKFDENDLVMIMWSSVSREDRYKNGWITVGNVYTQNTIDMDFVNEWANLRGYLIRDLALVELTKQYLKNLPCDSDMLAMCKFHHQIFVHDQKLNENRDVLEYYKETIASVKPDIFDQVYKGVWPTNPIKGRKGSGQTVDRHPTPIGYYKYLELLYPDLVTKAMKMYAEKYDELVKNVSHIDETQEFWSANSISRL